MKQIILTLIAMVFTFSAFSQTSSLQEGDECFDSGDYACAVTKYNEAIKSATGRDKQIAEIKLSRAKSCLEWLKSANQAFNQGNYKIAKENYQNVLNENPNDSYSTAQLERCYQELISLKVSKSNLTFFASGGSETITVMTEADTYSIKSIPSWCNVRQEKNSFTVSCSKNTENTTRNGNFEVTAGNKTERISISQSGKITLATSQMNVLFIASQKTPVIIDVKTNGTDYEVTDLPDWCWVGKKASTWFTLVPQTNISNVARKGYIKVSSGDEIVRIEISQEGRVNEITNFKNQKSNSSTSSVYRKPRNKKRCFNCPLISEKWGLTLGYIQQEYDPFDQMPLSPDAYLNGIKFGLRFDPLFKYGFGLNTGIFFEAYSNDFSSTISGDSKLGQYSINIPLHLEYRLNFSRGFTMFAYGGPSFNSVGNSTSIENSLPATFEYGTGLRIHRIQFNLGKSWYLGDFRDFSNMGKETYRYQNFILSMSYMF
jgi:hypothetical protein